MARELSDEARERMARGGEWLRRTRQQRGYETVDEFARALGIKRNRLTTYERGLYSVDPEMARKIANVLALPEIAVWQNLGLPLPGEAEALIDSFRAHLRAQGADEGDPKQFREAADALLASFRASQPPSKRGRRRADPDGGEPHLRDTASG